MQTLAARVEDTSTPVLDHAADAAPAAFDALRGYQCMKLTSFRRSGPPVATTVWFAEVDGRLYVTTAVRSGKVTRAPHAACPGDAVHRVGRPSRASSPWSRGLPHSKSDPEQVGIGSGRRVVRRTRVARRHAQSIASRSRHRLVRARPARSASAVARSN